jgi:hypothetical protein
LDSITLTIEILERGLSRNGGYSSKQLKLFGIEGFPKGWKKGLVGQSFPRELVNEFIELKDRHL